MEFPFTPGLTGMWVRVNVLISFINHLSNKHSTSTKEMLGYWMVGDDVWKAIRDMCVENLFALLVITWMVP